MFRVISLIWEIPGQASFWGKEPHGKQESIYSTVWRPLRFSNLRCCTSSWRRVDDPMIPGRLKISGIYGNSILAKTEAALSELDVAGRQ